ncbi:hypothetical protein [Aeromicrobium sp. CTD01-1L150]|uniref:hypothetical protein n=1 Tax=Aeromicrobium sp. CTD01-1L150 TaxID=3341830 RepID=UPI0035BF2EDF
MTTSQSPQHSSVNGHASSQSSQNARWVTKREAIAAARAKIAIDKRRGRTSEAWIMELASEGR